MPYIKTERRKRFDWHEGADIPINAGELNFLITDIIKRYWELHNMNYQGINDVLGALEGAKLEFYRRVVVPYEEAKIKTNGDVY